MELQLPSRRESGGCYVGGVEEQGMLALGSVGVGGVSDQLQG